MTAKKEVVPEKKGKLLIKAFRKNISVITLVSTFWGYVFLLSYTWPMSFVPVISLESLPFLMLGLVVILMFIWVFSLLLGLPFDRKVSNFLIGETSKLSVVEMVYFLLFLFVSFIAWLFAAFITPLVIPLAMLFLILAAYKKLDKYSFLAVAFILFFFGTVYCIIFYEVVFKNIVLLVLMIVLYSWYSQIIFNKNSIYQFFGKLFILLLVILFVPFFLSQFDFNGKGIKPHFLVKAGLRLVHLGGGIPVNIVHSPQSDKLITGELLFYDGKKAWVRECEFEYKIENKKAGGATVNSTLPKKQRDETAKETAVRVTEVLVQKIEYLDSVKVSCETKGEMKK